MKYNHFLIVLIETNCFKMNFLTAVHFHCACCSTNQHDPRKVISGYKEWGNGVND